MNQISSINNSTNKQINKNLVFDLDSPQDNKNEIWYTHISSNLIASDLNNTSELWLHNHPHTNN